MAENILLGALRRYEFYSYCSTFIKTFYDTVTQDLYGDIHWEWTYSTTNTYAQPKSWNTGLNSIANQGTITAKNLRDSNLFFTISMNSSSYTYASDNSRGAYSKNYVLRTGLKNNGVTIIPDLYKELGAISEVPFHTMDYNSVYSGDYQRVHTAVNVYWKWNLFISENYIFIYGEPQTNLNVAYPFRMYLGKIKAFEEEDPLIADDSVGIFSHFPHGMIDNDDELKFRTGRGYMRSSRNGTPNALYHFATSSQVPSPGVGGRFFISPFYVWHETEGARGEFHGIRTAVLRDASKYPDGSILDLGDERYYIFHALNQAHPAANQQFYATNGTAYAGQPYFFDSPLLLGGGQRVLLFEIEKEV
ncbi:hypothetical protein HUB98_05285 [Paenibacillus barcinonensis]|uniref:Uncharacterized protein n=1 Tax=Paenibacillus barcinonensis TaxID=198119 RepID=A0A2V4WGX3_PAEBA|nr:hypothetical protein [Paenibacillus barcinonensis]PYE51400.1 hypothetical protein DFQ00_102194 [Paenibacillus barcinonensis]QKS55796.1 hypothetical protein HUB98_05285 [Paenibacillus barcinonensis]